MSDTHDQSLPAYFPLVQSIEDLLIVIFQLEAYSLEMVGLLRWCYASLLLSLSSVAHFDTQLHGALLYQHKYGNGKFVDTYRWYSVVAEVESPQKSAHHKSQLNLCEWPA
jgi:hypothetical protein